MKPVIIPLLLLCLVSGCSTTTTSSTPVVAPGIHLPTTQSEAVQSLKANGYKIVGSNSEGITATKPGGNSPDPGMANQMESLKPSSNFDRMMGGTDGYKMIPQKTIYKYGFTNGIYNGNYSSNSEGKVVPQ